MQHTKVGRTLDVARRLKEVRHKLKVHAEKFKNWSTVVARVDRYGVEFEQAVLQQLRALPRSVAPLPSTAAGSRKKAFVLISFTVNCNCTCSVLRSLAE